MQNLPLKSNYLSLKSICLILKSTTGSACNYWTVNKTISPSSCFICGVSWARTLWNVPAFVHWTTNTTIQVVQLTTNTQLRFIACTRIFGLMLVNDHIFKLNSKIKWFLFLFLFSSYISHHYSAQLLLLNSPHNL